MRKKSIENILKESISAKLSPADLTEIFAEIEDSLKFAEVEN